MTKFINQYMELYKEEYIEKNLLVSDAIIYSKYYLYYKTKNCIYNDEIMNIIYNIEYNLKNC